MQQGKLYGSATGDVDKRKKMGSRLGLVYNIDKRNTIGFLLIGNFAFGGITNTTTGIGTTGAAGFEQTMRAVNDYYFRQTNRYNANVNYRYEHESGTMLNLNLDHGSFTKGNGNLQSNVYTDDQSALLSERYYRSLNDIDINLGASAFATNTSMQETKTIWTIGHSTHSFEEFLAWLTSFDIELIADIRTYPGSRKPPCLGKR